jgi:hypothetical protein
MDGSGEAAPARPRRCPLCGRATMPRFRPFCSAGCRDRDLLAWLDGRRVVPGGDPEAAGPGEGDGPDPLPDDPVR